MVVSAGWREQEFPSDDEDSLLDFPLVTTFSRIPPGRGRTSSAWSPG